MPLPKTKNVGKIMHELKSGKKRSRKQRVAISLSHARKMGAKIEGLETIKELHKKIFTGKQFSNPNKIIEEIMKYFSKKKN